MEVALHVRIRCPFYLNLSMLIFFFIQKNTFSVVKLEKFSYLIIKKKNTYNSTEKSFFEIQKLAYRSVGLSSTRGLRAVSYKYKSEAFSRIIGKVSCIFYSSLVREKYCPIVSYSNSAYLYGKQIFEVNVLSIEKSFSSRFRRYKSRLSKPVE